MNKTILLLLLAFIGLSTANAQVGIGTTSPDASAILDVSVDNLPANAKKGFLPPRMTSVDRNAITSPAAGLTIYNITNKCLETYNGASWISLCSGSPLTIENACANQSPTAVVEVTAAGHIWMDRNLGASRAAQSSTDFEAYGNLYQWGRSSDGHECINWTSSTGSDGAEQSNESTTPSASPNPGSTFITGSANWYNGTNPDDLWKPDLTGVNNPCPAGYRVPSETELIALDSSFTPSTGVGAINSPLALPMAGYRDAADGLLKQFGSFAYYWSSTSNSGLTAALLLSDSDSAVASTIQAHGFSVRCLKD